jgi:CBS domain-containing protein
MSPRAAARLESFGFTDVYEYAPGKDDWAAAGLPTEGDALAEPRVLDAMTEVATCRPGDTVEDARVKLGEGDRRNVVVTTDDATILGRIRTRALESDGATPVEDVMEIGPTTYRANVDLEALVERMQERKSGSVLVSNANGQLLGILYRSDAERYLAKRQGLGQR